MLAISVAAHKTWGMQGKSSPDRQMLDAAAFCRQLVPEDSVQAFLADHRSELFVDEDFADLFPSGKGRPSIPGEVICSVMVLQALEGLSDRDAIHQLRTRIDWKVACGLALDDEVSTPQSSPTGGPDCGVRSAPSGSSRRCGR